MQTLAKKRRRRQLGVWLCYDTQKSSTWVVHSRKISQTKSQGTQWSNGSERFSHLDSQYSTLPSGILPLLITLSKDLPFMLICWMLLDQWQSTCNYRINARFWLLLILLVSNFFSFCLFSYVDSVVLCY